jgi:hypothetical protein
MRCTRPLFVFIPAMLFGTLAQAQDNNSPPAGCQAVVNNIFPKLKPALPGNRSSVSSEVERKSAVASAMRRLEDWSPFVVALAPESKGASNAIQAQGRSEVEQNRQDKQAGATSNSSGSTTLVSKGSSPSLLGFALEHGGLTQTTSGNTITFRGNVVNSVTALLKTTYLDSYELSHSDPLVGYLSKVSFGVSFDTQANQPSTAQGFEPSTKNFSGFSVKYDIYNHRDPRDKRYRDTWKKFSDSVGRQAANSIGDLDDLIRFNSARFNTWESKVLADTENLSKSQNPSDSDYTKVITDACTSFVASFADDPAIQKAITQTGLKLGAYSEGVANRIKEIRSTTITTIEYNLTRQLTTNDKNITATRPNQKIPDLSNVNLVLERGFSSADTPELTLNVGGTWFNSPNTADPKRGRVRDIRASLEADWQLVALDKLSKPTLSLSGQYLNLFAEPLGQQVMLNGVTIVRRGPMELFQAKLSIPLGKSSGVKVPVSFTYASRTELVKESDVRGNIGITFDLDTLFSKAK